MKDLRLLITKKCNRSCEGCCNKQFDIDAVTTISPKDASKYDMVMITGGEPLLFMSETVSLTQYLKSHNPNISVYVYTAKLDVVDDFLRVLRISDGITLTLHEKEDIGYFLKLNDILLKNPILTENKSLRLNIFKEVGTFTVPMDHWIVKDEIEWIEDCPVPDNESFKVLDNLC